VFGQITADRSPGPWPAAFGWPISSTLPGLFLESMKTSVELVSDEMPKDRSKLIHSVGGAASVKFVWEPNEYTGLFQGSDYGLLRAASATEPSEGQGKAAIDSQFVPGIGIKMLRDGVPSGNVVFLHKLTPQDSWNFFKYPVSNHLSANGLGVAESALKMKFETSGSDWVNMVGLSDVARYTQAGVRVPDATLNVPFQLLMVPDEALVSKFPDSYQTSLIKQLSSIPVGSTLYSVQAKASYDSPLVTIGKMVLTSAFDSSVYADTKLFLKHQIMEEDLALRPEWAARCPLDEVSEDPKICPICPVDAAC
jgi:hypothetical protein